MSILATAQTSFSLQALIAILILFFACALAIWLRVHHSAAVQGPQRLRLREQAFPLVIAVGATVILWLGVQIMYGVWKRHGLMVAAHGQPVAFDSGDFTISDWAFLATAPALAGFAVLWFSDWLIGGSDLLDRLGFRLRKFPIGIGMGLLAALVILPLTFCINGITDGLYTYFHITHPAEHELLKVMGESHNKAQRWVLILAATLVAPLFEEFLFRVHLQTLFRRMLALLFSPPQAVFDLAVVAGPDLAVQFPDLPPLALPAGPVPPPLQMPAPPLARVSTPTWQIWLAIVLTSCAFALVHPMWMWPPIFFLSLGLGYCYERTGNAWTNMTVHCLFNSVSTLMFLTLMHP